MSEVNEIFQLNDDIINGVKLTNRVLECNHQVIKKRVKKILSFDFDIYTHKSNCFDNSNPIFTIILTMYDANIKYIEQSLNSVFEQDYKNTEVILINNGAKGKVEELIVNKFLDNKNATLLQFATHLFDFTKGDLDNPIFNIFNAGLFCSVGDFVYFLSYDDCLSNNYASRMVDLFESNKNCCTAAPLVKVMDEFGVVNVANPISGEKPNNREIYTNGIKLAEDKMRGGILFRYPGGALAVKSELVLSCGGFDDLSDISQLFKFAINGESGLDRDAHLYWRNHSQQGNKKMARNGLLYFNSYDDFIKNYDIYKLHSKVVGMDFADEFMDYFSKLKNLNALNSCAQSYSYGFFPAVKALRQAFNQCPPQTSLKALYMFIYQIPIFLWKDVTPVFIKRIYRKLKRLFI